MNIYKNFKNILSKNPNKTMLMDFNKKTSFQDFDFNIQKKIEFLQQNSIQENTIIIVETNSNINLLSYLFASSFLNCAFVTIDPSLKTEEKNNILNQIHPFNFIYIENDRLVELSQSSKGLNNIGMIQFSSGSTGHPKGILLSHESIYFRTQYLLDALSLTPLDKTLCTIPLSHSHGIDCLALTSILSGGELHIIPSQLASPTTVLSYIEDYKITFFSNLPAFYANCIHLPEKFNYNLSSLRLAFCGSAAINPTISEMFYSRFNTYIRQGYGLSEVCVITLNVEHPEQFQSIGRPIRGIDWRISADKELIVKSKAMFSGYLQADEKIQTEEFELYTGDLIEVDQSGLFYIIGRKNDFININGLKVFPIEIENKVKDIISHQDVCISSESDPTTGEKVVLHLTMPHKNSDPQTFLSDLNTKLKNQLSDFKLPKSTYIYKELPKSPLGKIIKNKIRVEDAISYRNF